VQIRCFSVSMIQHWSTLFCAQHTWVHSGCVKNPQGL
jgi:hypothetical protein